MKKFGKLRLSKEVLRQLDAGSLGRVRGGWQMTDPRLGACSDTEKNCTSHLGDCTSNCPSQYNDCYTEVQACYSYYC